jgi:DNA-binding CsgD family transcriptional regulator
MEKRKNRSDHYQHLLLETTYSNDMMEAFCNEDSIHKRLNPFDYNEDVLVLEDQLKVEFWRIVDTKLTSRQREVIRLYAQGYTQMEIAKILNVNQSSVTKSLNGNVDYKNGKKVYGGCKKKIQKIIKEDKKIQEIIQKISDLRDTTY